MKSFKNYKQSQEKFSIRKKSIGVVSLAIAATLAVAGLADTASADEVSVNENVETNIVSDASALEDTAGEVAVTAVNENVTTETAPAATTGTTGDVLTDTSSTLTVVSEETKGTNTVTTYDVDTQELTDAATDAATAGVKVEQGEAKYYNTVEEAVAANQAQAKVVKLATETYKEAVAQYETERSAYETALAQYESQKAAYDQYQAEVATGKGAGIVATAQDLILEKEPNALLAANGINVYITKESAEALASKNILDSYDVSSLTWDKVTPDNEFTSNEDIWALVSTGDSFSATYTNLENSSVDGKAIAKIVYTYTLVSSTNSRETAIVTLHHDPTRTITIGSNTASSDAKLTVNVKIQFFDKADQEIDLSASSVIVSLSSLNHWNGMAYVTNEKPQAVEVAAYDVKGKLVTVAVDVYADGSVPSLNNGTAVAKSLAAAFGDDVVLSNSNPARFVVDGSAISATSVAAKDQNGNTKDADGNTFGTYTIDPATGLVTYTPTVKYDKSNHIESVTIGNNTYIQVPGSSVTNQNGVVYAVNDNEYMAHGSTFNAAAGAGGWDSQSSPTYYYGSAAVVLKDGNLSFTVTGNEVGTNTVYWFAINSKVAVPTAPGEKPVEPTAPVSPTVTVNDAYVKVTEETPKKDKPQKPIQHDDCWPNHGGHKRHGQKDIDFDNHKGRRDYDFGGHKHKGGHRRIDFGYSYQFKEINYGGYHHGFCYCAPVKFYYQIPSYRSVFYYRSSFRGTTYRFASANFGRGGRSIHFKHC
ncbi:GbpC/Spa domain-containing protein [Streptococcus dentiloxodontae]